MDRFFQWVSSGVTHVGNVRKINEDSILDCPQRGLWVVADGMGGHKAGDVASSSIVNSLTDIDDFDKPSQLVDRIEDLVLTVNRDLYAMSQRDGGGTIGSTVAILLAISGHGLCIWAGDSRVYRLRDYKLEQMTTDHSEVEALIAEGTLQRSEAADYPGENVITRAVGGENELILEVRLFPLRRKDRYLICSDGLFKDVTFDEIGEFMSDGNAAEVSQKLVACALSRRCSDNVSVITVEFDQR